MLVEPGGHIGGMVSGGLSWTDVAIRTLSATSRGLSTGAWSTTTASAVRMEPTLMALGEAAGLAAAQAARRGIAVQDVDVAALRSGVPAL